MAAEVIRTALLEQRRRVEIYRMERSSWILERKGSPGNLQAFEEECMVNGELPAGSDAVIVAVKLGRTAGSKGYSGDGRVVGACVIDCAGRAIRTCEFEDGRRVALHE